MCSQIDMFSTPHKSEFYKFSLEEVSRYVPRKVLVKEIGFEEFARNEGFPNIVNQALDGICSELFFNMTRQNTAEYNKRQSGRKARDKLEELKRKYQNSLDNGEIKSWYELIPLNIAKESDRARAKMALRRSCQVAHRKGLEIPEENKIYLTF
ncbi:hypothetical protein A3715_14045 [Oleiphilus sp. HI0009]|nr:hypothetical protein A3715_14045 [Oleiphilus sp. HI0009]